MPRLMQLFKCNTALCLVGVAVWTLWAWRLNQMVPIDYAYIVNIITPILYGAVLCWCFRRKSGLLFLTPLMAVVLNITFGIFLYTQDSGFIVLGGVLALLLMYTGIAIIFWPAGKLRPTNNALKGTANDAVP
jgi:hypothetical protein